MSTNLTVVHNIPSPYRLHLFNELQKASVERGVPFRVEFMAMGHDDRKHWQADSGRIAFEHRYWRDRGVTVRGHRWHWNPGLVQELRRTKPACLMVGGAWDSVTAGVLTLLKPCEVLVSWLEGNPKDVGRIAGAAGWMKRVLTSRPECFAVPGKSGRDFIRDYGGGAKERPVLTLPNLVDEKLFRRTSPAERTRLRSKFGLPAERRVALWPARLIPAKGILEFLRAVEPADFAGGVVLIVGDGPLREAVLRERDRCGLSEIVRLREAVRYEEMPDLYGAADLFLLPSVRDPNPLSVVEALHSGLPLILSMMAGNAAEALPDERNGWTVNPFDAASVRSAVQEAFVADAARLETMGARSKCVGEEFWNSGRAASSFVDGLLRVRDGRKGRAG